MQVGSSAPVAQPRGQVGLVLPSDNVTQEHELARLLSAAGLSGISVHASRMRLPATSQSYLRVMAMQTERAVLELGDIDPDVILHGGFTWDEQTASRSTEASSRVAEQLAHGGSDARVRSFEGVMLSELREFGHVTAGALLAPAQGSYGDFAAACAGLPLTLRWAETLDRHPREITVADVVDQGTRMLQRAPVDLLVLGADGRLPALDAAAQIERTHAIRVLHPAQAVYRTVIDALTSPAGQLNSAEHPALSHHHLQKGR